MGSDWAMWMSAGRFTADARSPEMAVSGGVILWRERCGFRACELH